MSSITTNTNSAGYLHSVSSTSSSSSSYWKSTSTTNNSNSSGSLSSGNHSPLSSTSSSSSLNGPTMINIKGYNNSNTSGNSGIGLLSPVSTNNSSSSTSPSSRYQSPYFESGLMKNGTQYQQAHHPSPMPRTINTINNNSNTSSMNGSRGLYTSSFADEQRGTVTGTGMMRNTYSIPSNNTSGANMRKMIAHGSSHEINVTVNSSTPSSNELNGKRSKYYTNGIASANGGGGNYYVPGTDSSTNNNRDNNNSTISSSSGGVSVLVGRSSSYNHINNIGRTSSYNSGNHNNYFFNSGQQQQQQQSKLNVTTNNGLTQQEQHSYQRFAAANNNSNSHLHQQQQQRRMNNAGGGMTNNSANNIISNSPSSTTSTTTPNLTSLNGTVAVAVVTRSQNGKQVQNETNSYHNSNSSRYSTNLSNTTVIGGNNNNNSVGRHNNIGSSEQQQPNNSNCTIINQHNNSSHHRPAQRLNSYPTTGTTTVTTTTKMEDLLDGEAHSTTNSSLRLKNNANNNNSKKISGGVTTMIHNNSSVGGGGIRKKGILRKDAKKKKMSVTFPKEVVQVIGFGGDTSDEESDDDPVYDPLDSASIPELLEKSSSSLLEKELNRLTTKNTNFNSIKTNLLGYTCIEFGPIVGCMNGNSLNGPSKPLISIGTFETRGQPSSKGKKNEEKEQKNKKSEPIIKLNGLTSTNNNSNSSRVLNSAISTTKSSNTITTTSNNSNNSSNQIKSKTTSLSHFNVANNNTNNNNSSKTMTEKVSTPNATNSITKSNVNVVVNSTKTEMKSAISSISSSFNNKSAKTSSSRNDVTGNTSTNTTVISAINVNKENVSSKLTTATAATNTTQKTVVNETLSNHNNNSSQPSTEVEVNSSEPPPPIPTSSAPTKTTPTPLSNLYILNDGNIASRRSTFLNDILSLDMPITLDINEDDSNGAISLGQQDSLEPSCNNTKLEVNLEETLPVSSPSISNTTSTAVDVNSFDDSLEDSGLDIKTTKLKQGLLGDASSESDNEKSGSNSDSGTEQDFMSKHSNRNKQTTMSNTSSTIAKEKELGNDGLFISVEESTAINAKLSPDSVLNEMLNAEDELPNVDEDDVPPLEVVPPPENICNAPLSSGPAIPPILKRLAPPPPRAEQSAHQSIYSNEELYDDVATVREQISVNCSKNENRPAAPVPKSRYPNVEPDCIEESLYDDCTTIGPPPPSSGKTTKSGSYDFTDSNNRSGLLDPDLNEKIPLRPDDGIEFIGIRKIDSESFLKQHTPPPASDSSPPSGKKERGTGSSSPKPKRRVNQFFSTIGKRAGAAFSRTPLDFSSSASSSNKQSSPTSPLSPTDFNATAFSQFSKFKRSLSQDEVSMTRTQEIYATLSPAMLKNNGLAPVLNKLSKLDLQVNTNAKEKDDDKISRKNKFSSSLKKFLKFGSKDGDNKYEFGQASPTGSEKSSPSKPNEFVPDSSTKSKRNSSSSISSSPRHSSVSHLEEISSNNPGKYYVGPSLGQQQQSSRHSNDNILNNYGISGTCPTRPPPPPPRVYSFDQLNNFKGDETSLQHSYQPGQQHQQFNYNNNNGSTNGQSGSGSMPSHASGSHGPKPARPPPPVIRANKVAPSFTSVFANHESDMNESSSYYSNINSSHEMQREQPQLPPPLNGRRPTSASMNAGINDTVRGGANNNSHPPNKPKRKASLYRPGESGDQGAYTANYLETTYNHITSLNFETLKLIASQTPATIRRGASSNQKFTKASPLRWSQFYVTDVEPLTNGKGFCFYSAFWEDESCILLLQESLSCGNPPLEFECIDSMASFEDIIPSQFITWKPSEFVNTGAGIKVFVSVLPSCTVQTLTAYLNNTSISPSRKYFALLQAMDYWGRDDMSDLIVFHQIPAEGDSSLSDYSCGSLASKSKHSTSPNFGLVYVASTRLKAGSLLSPCSRGNFETAMNKLLFTQNSHHHQQLLCDNDRSILYRRISGCGTHEVEAQLKLFLQLKLFGAQGNDLDKILRYRSDKQVTQWMDKERAFCMKDAIERTLKRNSEPISPLRKSFVEFLMISDSCAKAVLDLIVDLNPDL